MEAARRWWEATDALITAPAEPWKELAHYRLTTEPGPAARRRDLPSSATLTAVAAVIGAIATALNAIRGR